MYTKLIRYAALCGISLLFFDALASKFYWYASMPHSDMIAHTLGGMFTGFLIAALAWRAEKGQGSALRQAGMVVLYTACIGLLWEYYEYVVHVVVRQSRFVDVPNTVSDILCDIFGGIIAAVVVFRKNTRYNSSNGNKS